MKKNLVLTGMMGVGKTTIGKRLSRKLKMRFIDIDQIIEKNEKKTIKEIFEIKGENYFRKIEKNTSLNILKKRNLVIALGGGAFLNSTVRKEIITSSISFWLDLSEKSLLKRLKNIKKRPLLKEDSLKEDINKIYSERKKIYDQSNFRVKCDTLDLYQIVNKIVKIYENTTN